MNNSNAKEHYKMYKSGKQWLFATITTIALAGVLGVVQSGTHLDNQVAADTTGTTTNGFDTTPYVPKGDQSGLGSVSFSSKREALIGKYVDALPVQTNVAADPNNASQSINYQIKNVYVYLNPNNIVNGQPQLVAVYVPGKTSISISPNGTQNTVSVDIGQNTGQWNNTALQGSIANGSADTGWNNIKQVYTPVGSWQDFQVPSLSDSDAAKYNAIRLSFVSNKNVGGASGNQDYYLNLNVKFENDATLQQEIAQQTQDQKTLDGYRQTDISALANQGDQTKTTISNDKTLTAAQKQAAENQVDANVQAAQAKLNDTSYLKDYAANKAAAQALATQYTSGKPVDQQRSDEQAALTQAAQTQTQLIDADNGLTTAQKNSQKAAITTALNNATQALNNATDADDIQNVANSADASAINNGYQKSTTTPAQQRDSAVANQEAAVNDATGTNGKINSDPTLSTADRQARIQAINDALNTLKNLPDSATAQNVADAQAAVQKAISDGETSGTSVDQQKTNAIAKFKADNNVDQKLQDIANDPTLTDVEKASQTKAITDAVASVTSKINNATDADGINNAAGDTTAAATIAGAHQSASSATQAQRQQAALSAVTTAQQQAKDAVDTDANLTTQEKSDQKAAIDAAAAQLNAQITGSGATAQNDENIQNNAATNLSALHQVGQDLSDRKTTAAQQIQTQADSAIATIKNSTLPENEQEEQIKSIQAAADSAKAKIQAAATADDVVADLKSGSQTLTDLVNAQTAATTQINAAATTAKNAIDQESGLTDTEKANQKTAVDNAAAAAKAQANAATDANDVTTAAQSGQNLINGLNQDKSNAYSSVGQQAQDAHTAVNNNQNLTQAQKDQLNTAIDNAAAAAKNTIDQATTTDGVTNGQNAADLTTAVNNANNPAQVSGLADGGYQTLADKQKQLTGSIDTAAQQAKDAIDQEAGLTDTEKANQKAAIDNAATTAKQNVTNAQNAQAAADAAQSGQNLISGLNQDKSNAYSSVGQQAQDAHTAVNNNQNLTQAQKDQLNTAIDTAAAAAKNTIDQATTTDGVTNGQNAADLTTAVNNANNPAQVSGLADGGYQTLADKQKQLAGSIDTAATAAKNAIDQETGLTDTEKTNQKAAIDNAATTAKQNVTNAQNAQAAADAAQSGQNLINGLNQDKSTARNNVDTSAQNAKDQVNNNQNLTQAQKDQLNTAIDNAAAAAKNTIDQATTTDGVTNGQNAADLTTAVNNANNPAQVSGLADGGYQTLADKQKQLTGSIDTAAQQAKDAIDQEAGLTDTEKANQKAAIDNAATTAKQNVTNAQNAQAAADAAQSGQNLISGLNQDKSNAYSSVGQQAQDAHTAVNNNQNLTQAQKDQLNTAIDNAAAAAKNTIDQATTTDGVTNGQNAADLTTAVNNANNPAQVSGLADGGYQTLADKQKQLTGSIDTAAQQAKDAIDQEAGLTDTEKANQKAAIDNAATTAKQNVTNAQNAQAAADAAQSGQNLISGLNQDKSNAYSSVGQQAQDAHTAVNNNQNLTQAQKDQLNTAIDTAAAAAKNTIDQATTTDGVTNGQNAADLTTAVNNANNPAQVSGLADGGYQTLADKQKQLAGSIDTAATAAKNAIDQETGLTDTEKTNQKAAIDNAATTAKQNVTNAQNAQAAADAAQSGQNLINGLNQDKSTARNNVDTSAQNAKDQVNNNQNLTQAQKDQLNTAIDNAAAAAKNTIDQATTTDGVTNGQNAADLTTAVNNANNPAQVSGLADGGYQTLADKQKQLTGSIDTAAQQAKDAIDQEAGLTDTEKANQKAAIDNAATTAKQNVTNAQNAQAAADAAQSGQNLISGLNQDKSNAYSSVGQQAQDAHTAVNNNQNLTQAQKDQLNTAIDNAAAAAKNTIDQATTTDGVTNGQNAADLTTAVNNANNPAQVSGLADGGYQTLADKQKQLTGSIDTAAQQAKDAIDQEAGLTDTEKANQKAAIDNAATTAKQNVTNAQNAQAAADAAQSGQNLISGLNQDKSNAYSSVGQQAQDAHTAVNNNQNLTQAQKDQLNTAIDTAAAAAKNTIDQATTTDGVTNGQNAADLTTAVNNANNPAQVSGLADGGYQTLADKQKQLAGSIDTAATAAKNAIDQETGLTDTEKTNQKAAIDNAATTAKQNVTNAQNAQAAADAAQSGQNLINGLNQDKSTARNNVDTSAQNAKDQVNNNQNLTQAQKDQLNTAIDNAAAAAKNTIDQATTTDGVTNGQNAADLTTAVNNANNPAQVSGLADGGYQTLADKQKQLTGSIDTAAQQAKDAIDQETGLTDTEKTNQKAAIDNAATTAKQNVTNAQNAQAAADAAQSGQNLISGLNQDKSNAYSSVGQQAQDAHTAVNNNQNLTQAQKDQLNTAIDTAAAAAKNTIDQATTTDGVTNGQNAADLTTAVNNANNPAQVSGLADGGYQTLADKQKQLAGSIDTAATAAKNAIDQETGLTDTEKTNQKAAIDNAATTAKQNVTNAQNAQAAADAAQSGQNLINGLNQDKSTARNNVDTSAQNAKDQVNNNQNLTQAQKDQLNTAIDTAAAAAKNTIDQATTTDGVTNGQNAADLTTAVNNANNPAQVSGLADGGYQTLADKQKQLTGSIDTAATTAKNAIDQETGLTDTEKTNQKAAIDNAATTAKQNVTNAQNAQAAADAAQSGQNLINGLNQDKSTARNNVDTSAQNAKDQVNNNQNLTQAQKDQLNTAIDNAAAAAKNTIDQATTTDGVTNGQNAADLTTAVNNANNPAQVSGLADGGYQTLADKQKQLTGSIDTAAQQAKDAIDQETGLTDTEKTNQKAAIDNAATTAKQNVTNAQNAQAAADAAQSGQNLINGLNQDKSTARNNVDTSAQNAKDQVNNNQNLTQAQKDQLNTAIDNAAAAAKNTIDQATTADGVTNGQNAADLTTAVNNANNPAQVSGLADGGYQTLADKQKQLTGSIDTAATTAKNAIDQEAGLSDTEKANQKAAIDNAATTAKQNVTNAQNAQAAADAAQSGQNLINAQKDADNTLAQKATAGRDAINNNAALNDSGDVNDVNSKAYALQDFNNKVAAAQSSINAAAKPADATNAVATGSDLDTAMNTLTANKQIDDAAKDAKAKIEADPNLSAADKQAQEAIVDQQAKTSKAAAETAAHNQDSTVLNQVVATAKTNFSDLADAKRAADDALASKVQDATAAINSNIDLTDAQKQSRLNDLAKAQQAAQDAINAATTTTDASSASDDKSTFSQAADTVQNFDNVPSLSNQKEAALRAVQTAAQQAKDSIDQNTTLSATSKAAQKAGIDKLEAEQEQTINQSNDAQHLSDNQSAGEQAVTDLAQNMTAASDAIATKIADLNTAIDDNSSLTADEKANQKAALVKASQVSQNQIDGSKDAATAAAAQQPSLTALDNLNNSKVVAYTNINQAYEQALKDIDQDQNLDQTAKDAQKAAVQAAMQAATDKIDNALAPSGSTDGSDVQALASQVTGNLMNLNQDKDSARQKLQNQADQVINAIQSDSNLSDAEKADQIQNIKAAVTKAQGQIDAGLTPENVNAVPDSNEVQQKVTNGHQQATDTLAQQKQNALSVLENQAAQMKAAINSDNTLSTNEKANQIAAIEKSLTDAKNDVNTASTAQQVLDAKLNTTNQMEKAHQPGIDLPAQKAAAIASIDQKANAIRAQIFNDPNLTQDQKNEDYAKLDAAVAKAKAEVNGALNADTILSGLDYGTTQAEISYKKDVQQQYESAKALADRQAAVQAVPYKKDVQQQYESAKVEVPYKKDVQQKHESAKAQTDRQATAKTRVARFSSANAVGLVSLLTLSGLMLFFARRKRNED